MRKRSQNKANDSKRFLINLCQLARTHLCYRPFAVHPNHGSLAQVRFLGVGALDPGQQHGVANFILTLPWVSFGIFNIYIYIYPFHWQKVNISGV